MMRRYIIIQLFLVCILSSLVGYSQQSSILGHRELLSSFNPSLTSEDKGHISYLYRYQWEGLGPWSNTLFFNYPLAKSRGRLYAPYTIGSIFQYEELNILNRVALEFFGSSTLAKFKNTQVTLGLNAGFQYNGLNMNGLNVEELIDPELANIDRRFSLTNRLGISVRNHLFVFGIASRFIDVTSVSDYLSSLSLNLPLRNSKFRISPIGIFRMNSSFEYQLEGQLRTTYNDRLSVSAGYRQDFGAIFQLGIRLNKSVKASYGIETPSGEISPFGLTHELFGSYEFESRALVRHRQDSLIKERRDSLNRARVANYRKQRMERLKNRQKEDSLSLIANSKKLPTDTLASDSLIVKNTPTTKRKVRGPGVYKSLEDLTKNISDNTHIILNHIGFETGLYLLTPDSYKELERLFNYIKRNKKLHIEIQGHTDNSGSTETNLTLSKYRALAVYNYLVSKGIDRARMNIVGYGESLPLQPNDTKENRELNRRIEIVFLKKK